MGIHERKEREREHRREEILDAAQDVFLVALRRLDDFEGRSSLTTWLYGICVRVAHGYRRRERQPASLPQPCSLRARPTPSLPPLD